jgi:hypothetical protein
VLTDTSTTNTKSKMEVEMNAPMKNPNSLSGESGYHQRAEMSLADYRYMQHARFEGPNVGLRSQLQVILN